MTDEEDDLGGIRARLRHLDQAVSQIARDVRELRDAEKERMGREKAAEIKFQERHDDRWQVWVRAIIPTGALTAGWFALVNFLFGDGGR